MQSDVQHCIVDQQPLGLGLPRKLSLSSMQGGSLASPRDAALPSPRTRIGGTPGFEGVLGESWSSRRRGDSLSKPSVEAPPRREREPTDHGKDLKGPDIKEEDEDTARKAEQNSGAGAGSGVARPDAPAANGVDADNPDSVQGVNNGIATLSSGTNSDATSGVPSKPPGLTDLANIEWSYLDPQGNVQGKQSLPDCHAVNLTTTIPRSFPG